MPTSVGTNDDSKYKDNYWQSTENRVVYLGGRWSSVDAAGIACWGANISFGSSDCYIGSRLVKISY